MDRVEEFDALCDEMIAHLAAGDEESASTRLLGRSMAADLWRLGRAGDDSDEIQATVEAIRGRSAADARKNAFLCADERVRTRRIHIEAVAQNVELHDRLHGRVGKSSRRAGPRRRLKLVEAE